MEDIEPIVYEAPEGWYVIKRRKFVASNYEDSAGWPHVGSCRKIRPRKGTFTIRVRVKQIQRFEVFARWFHVVSDRPGPIAAHKEPLWFKTLDEAIAAGKRLDSFDARH